MNRIYFPALDGLRFIAFILVFIMHYLTRNPITENIPVLLIPLINFFQENGWIGLDLFFSLSGFLITTLLLQERRKFNKISLKNFWIRRALRIWPLYFLALFVGFFAIPALSQLLLQNDYTNIKYINHLKIHFPFFTLFLGNWSLILNGTPEFRNIPHLWSISVEEQFYIFWPILLIYTNTFKKALILSITLIILVFAIRFTIIPYVTPNPTIYMNTFTRLDTFIIGSLLGLITFYKPIYHQKLIKIYSIPFFIFLSFCFINYLSSISVLSSKNQFIQGFSYTIIAIYLTYLISYALIPGSFINRIMSLKTLVWLGKISYGLYIWHRLATDLAAFLTVKYQSSLLTLITSLIITILIASISYYYYELFFLKLKSKYTQINSKPI